MGLESDDIDIALDLVSGNQFAQYINEWLSSEGRSDEVATVGVIQVNPEQSKHLETANMRLYGVSIDFVNLRSETYSGK